MKLTRIAVDNPVFATMMMVALLVLGLFSYRQLGVDQFPNVDLPVVVVTTNYPGASPETVESEISRKIEESVNAIAGLKTLTSRSFEGQSIVIAEFELSVPAAGAMQDVREKVQQVRAGFKPEVKEPLIQRFNPDDQPIVSIAVRSDIRSARDLTTLADQIIVKRLQTVRDVGRATIAGGVKRQINIELDPGRMNSLRVGVNDVMKAVRDENQNFPAGNVQRGNDDRLVEVTGRMAEPGNFADLIVARRGPAPVYLRQVATVVDGQQEREDIAILNGERAVAIDIIKTQGSNTIEVARGVRKAVADLQTSLPPDVRLEIGRDASRGIQNSVNNVQETMIEGGLLTIAIVFLFLHSWRSTVITGLALPISVFGAFMVMAAFGFTLNVLTLMALSLAIGILIDDAIVVRENIMRHIGFGKTHRQAAIDGTNEIGLAVLATTLCIVAVFLPVAFMGGIIGRFFFQFGIVVSAAVLISLFVSFTLDPMLSSIWYDPQAQGTGRFARLVNRAQERANRVYRAVLGWALRWPKTVLLIALASFAGSFALPRYIGFEFAPQADLGEQVVSIETPIGSSLEYTEAKLRQVDAAVHEFPEVDYTYGTVNTGYANGKNQASLYLRLKPLSERKRSPEQLAAPIRERLASIPGILVSINIPGGPGGGIQKQIQLSLQGRDTAVLDTLSQEVMRRAAAIPGLVDLDRNLKAAKPVLSVRLRRDAASDLGLGSALVAQSLRPLFAGDETSLWRAPDGENYTVMVRLPVDDRTGVADLQRIWFTAGTEPNGLPRMVHIAQIADIVADVGASQINRRDLNREVQITANVSGRSVGRGRQRPAEDPGRHHAAAGLPLRVRRLDQGHQRERRLCRPGPAAGRHPDLPDPGLAVRQLPAAHRHHDVAADVADRRVPRPADRRHHPQPVQRHRLHHADGAGHQERHPACGFLQPGPRARRAGQRSPPRSGLDPPAAHPDDDARHDIRHAAARPRAGRRRQPARADGACGDRRPHKLDAAHPRRGAGGAGLHRPGEPVGDQALPPLGRRARPSPQACRVEFAARFRAQFLARFELCCRPCRMTPRPSACGSSNRFPPSTPSNGTPAHWRRARPATRSSATVS